MSNIYSQFKNAFLPLRAFGYFAEIENCEDEPRTYIVTCTMYITDRDEFGATTVLRYNPVDDPIRDEEGKCIACNGSCNDNQRGEIKRGSMICPLCGQMTKPWIMRKMISIGKFKASDPKDCGGGGAAEHVPFVWVEFLKNPIEDKTNMRSEHMIKAIAAAIKLSLSA